MGSELIDSDNDEPLEVEDLDFEEGEDLEAAMREALEAVEGGKRGSAPAEGDRGDGATMAAAVVDAESEGDEFDELATLRKEVAELRDRSVRTLADFDNFRKRAERERREHQRYEGSEVLRDLLDVVDNLERARDSNGGFQELKDGVELIVRQIVDLLRRYGVQRVEAAGKAFDPAVHEAVSREEGAEISVPTVRSELQSGYMMKDRLLRPAMVVVAVPAASAAESEDVDR